MGYDTFLTWFTTSSEVFKLEKQHYLGITKLEYALIGFVGGDENHWCGIYIIGW